MTNKLLFPIYFYDGGNVPKDDICYIITKKGPMIKKNLGMVESLVPVKDISILQELQSYVKLNIPKIPEDMVASILTFFRAIYNKHSAEAIVLIFYNENTKEYIIEPPPQEGNSASLDYTKGTLHFDGFTLIGTAHSHGSMSAFHSSVDDKDEESFDGLHITFGNVNADQFTLSCSVVSNGYRSIVEPEMYMGGVKKLEIKPEKPKDQYVTRYRYDHMQKKVVPYNVKMNYSYKPSIQIKYEMTIPSEKLKFNKEWLKQFTYQKFSGNYQKWHRGKKTYNHHGYGIYMDEDYLDSLWGIPGTPVKSPLNVGPAKTVNPANFGGNDILNDDINPCKKCVFLQHKIDWALNFYEWEDDEDEIDEDDYLMSDADEELEELELDSVDDHFEDPESDLIIISTEDVDMLSRDDGSQMCDEKIDDIVKEQHTSEDFLNGKPISIPGDESLTLTDWLKQRILRRK